MISFSILKNRYVNIFLTAFFPAVFLFASNIAFASPEIISSNLNGIEQNATFNPSAGENVSIYVKANEPVKFTRLYICSISQICNGTSGNYTKYFTQTTIEDSITKSWDGKNSAGAFASEGEYRIMASMLETGASSSVSAFAPYSITISSQPNQNSTTTSTSTNQNNNSTSTNQNNNSTSTNNSSNTNTEIKTITRTVYISAHSDEEDLSDYSANQTFVTSAGRQRIAYVGVPIEFRASFKLPKDMQSNINDFNWSFGDGFSDYGERVVHTYKHPGEYNVILNGVSGEEHSVSRTIVKVLSASISLSLDSEENLEVTNKGNIEINLGFWKLKNGSDEFVFAKDTIVGVGKGITLSSEDTKIKYENGKIALINPSGWEVISINNLSKVITNAAVQSADITVEKAEKLLAEYRKSFPQKVTTLNDPLFTKSNIEEANTETDSSNIATALESSEHIGFFAKAWKSSMLGLKSFARLFYDF